MTENVCIEHEAMVRRLFPQSSEVEVAISDNQSDSCASCAAAALCKHTGGILKIHVDNPQLFKCGENVIVGTDSATHRRAVGLMLGLPCLMLILPIVTMCVIGIAEWVALLVGVGACTLTYLILWWCRQKLDSSGQFKIISKAGSA